MTQDDILCMNKDRLLCRNTLFDIFREESEIERQYLLIALVNRAEQLKCKTQANQLIKVFASESEKAGQPEGLKECKPGVVRFSDSELKERELLCERFFADDNGIFTLSMLGRKIMACYTPIYPACILKNIETGREKVAVRYQKEKGGPWVEINVDKSVLVNHKQIVKLAEYGILVNSVGAKSLVEYMTAVEALNPIPTKKSSSRFGWYQMPVKTEEKAEKANVFVPYCHDIAIEDQGAANRLSKAIYPTGEADLWLSLFAKVLKDKNHFEPQFMVAASLASVLIGPLNLQPFIANIWGSTGKGKSLTLMLAASVWADPTGNKYIAEADNTRNALVKKCGTLNHLPLCIDDFSKITRKVTDNEDFIYSLCSGSEKERLDRESEFKTATTWQNVILTTNESPLAKEYMRGGAINRVLDIEMNMSEVFKDPAEVVNTLSKNYGFLGARFVSYIQQVGFDEVRQKQQEFRAELERLAREQGSMKENKQLLPLSVILTADYYLAELHQKELKDLVDDFETYTPLPVNYLLSQLKGIEEVSDGQRAYDSILGFINANPSKFIDLQENPAAKSLTEVCGYIKAFKNKLYVCFNPYKFNEFMRNNNFDVTAFCTWAKSKDLLDSNDKNRNQKKVRIGTSSINCYAIRLPEDEEEDFRPITEDEAAVFNDKH